MPQTITAIYEHGVFVPQTPVNLPEYAQVKVTIPKSAGKGCQATVSWTDHRPACGRKTRRAFP